MTVMLTFDLDFDMEKEHTCCEKGSKNIIKKVFRHWQTILKKCFLRSTPPCFMVIVIYVQTPWKRHVLVALKWTCAHWYIGKNLSECKLPGLSHK